MVSESGTGWPQQAGNGHWIPAALVAAVWRGCHAVEARRQAFLPIVYADGALPAELAPATLRPAFAYAGRHGVHLRASRAGGVRDRSLPPQCRVGARASGYALAVAARVDRGALWLGPPLLRPLSVPLS